jgi:hypothetical protein
MTKILSTEQPRAPPTTSSPVDAHQTQLLLGYYAIVPTRPETDLQLIAICAWSSPIRILIVTGVTNARTEPANATPKNIKRARRRLWNPGGNKSRVLEADQCRMPPTSLTERPSSGASCPGIRTTPPTVSSVAPPTSARPITPRARYCTGNSPCHPASLASPVHDRTRPGQPDEPASDMLQADIARLTARARLAAADVPYISTASGSASRPSSTARVRRAPTRCNRSSALS